jgi:uncharacterized protein with GYD domain
VPMYLISGSYTQAGIKGVMAEGGSGRVAAVTKLAESVGGRLECFYFGFGGDDFFIMVEMPGNEAAAAVAMMVGSSGFAETRTTVLLSAAEIDAACGLSPAYRAPGT